MFILFLHMHRPISDKYMHEEIRERNEKDRTMHTLISRIRDGWPESEWHVQSEIRDFWVHKDELSEVDEIVLRGERIVIPLSLRPRNAE